MLGHSSSGSFRPLCGRLTDISIVLGHHSATPAATVCLRLAVAATPIGTAPKTVLIAFLPLLGYGLAASVALRLLRCSLPGRLCGRLSLSGLVHRLHLLLSLLDPVYHLYVCCRLSSFPLFGRFLVISLVLSGRPPAVRPTLHPEASIGHSANYLSLFGAPFRPLVRSLVFNRLHLQAISAGCRSGYSYSVIGCLAAPVVVRLFRSLLYGCCTVDATILQPLHTATILQPLHTATPVGPFNWLVIPAAPDVFGPFRPLRFRALSDRSGCITAISAAIRPIRFLALFGRCPATPTVILSDGSASSMLSVIFWSFLSSFPVRWLSLVVVSLSSSQFVAIHLGWVIRPLSFCIFCLVVFVILLSSLYFFYLLLIILVMPALMIMMSAIMT